MADIKDEKQEAAKDQIALQEGLGSPHLVEEHIGEGAFLRKLDIRLLPAVGVLYLLSFLDRSNGALVPSL